MQIPHIVLVLFAAAALVNVCASSDDKKHARLIYFSKPLLMPLLIAYHVVSVEEIEWLLVCALGFGFLGDVFLMLPGEKEHNFMLGLAAFLVNQVLYVVLFITSAGGLVRVPASLAFGLAYLVFGIVYYRLLAPGLGKFKAPVIVYMICIISMGVAALLRWDAVSAQSFWLVTGGSLLFVVSDSVLAWDKFRGELRLGRVIVMATYIAAQFLITCGIGC